MRRNKKAQSTSRQFICEKIVFNHFSESYETAICIKSFVRYSEPLRTDLPCLLNDLCNTAIEWSWPVKCTFLSRERDALFWCYCFWTITSNKYKQVITMCIVIDSQHSVCNTKCDDWIFACKLAVCHFGWKIIQNIQKKKSEKSGGF